MSIEEKIETIAKNVPEVYEAGKQAEYDRFWDEFQQNGLRKDYWYAFSGTGWPKVLNPKYNIVFKEKIKTERFCQGMFYAFNRDRTMGEQMDVSEICSKIDFSGCLSANFVFAQAKIKNVFCDFGNCIQLSNTFNCNDGGSIDYIYLKVTEKCTEFSSTFFYCVNLTDIRFTEDSSIAADISLDRSPLNKESIENIIDTLSPTVINKTLKLKKTAVDNAFETSNGLADGSVSDEWIQLKNSKSNWIINLM